MEGGSDWCQVVVSVLTRCDQDPERSETSLDTETEKPIPFHVPLWHTATPGCFDQDSLVSCSGVQSKEWTWRARSGLHGIPRQG